MPVMRSCRKELIRASRVRMSRYALRTFRRKIEAAMMTSGSTANETSASRQSSSSIAVTIAPIVKMSPKIVTTPEVNISFSTSTSLVTRVISRPTGFRSKNASSSLCNREKTSARMSSMTFCPIHVVSSVRRYSRAAAASSEATNTTASVPRSPVSAVGTARSSAIFVSQGPTSSSPEAAISISTAAATCSR